MKLNARQIPEFMQRPRQSKGVLVYGPDEGLVRERVKALISALLGPAPDPFSIIELTEASLKENPTRLFEECAAMGLLASTRVIILRQPPEACAKDIEAVCTTLDESTYLIVGEGELTPRSPMRQLFEQHQLLAALACYREEAGQIASLIRNQVAQAGLSIRADALQALSQRLGNDHGISVSEVEKLITFVGNASEITLEDVNAVVPDNAQHEGNDVAFALVAGDAAGFDHHLNALLREGVPPTGVLRAVQRHIQRLSFVHGQAAGQGVEAAMKQLKPPVFFKEETAFKNQLKALSAAALIRLLKRVVDAEAAVKTGKTTQELALGELSFLSYRGK